MFWEIHSTRSERFFKSRDFAHREIPYSKKLQLFFPFVCQFDFVTAAFQANNYQQCWTCRWVGNKEVIYGCIENFFAHFMTFHGSKEVRYECNLLKAANQVFENHFYPFQQYHTTDADVHQFASQGIQLKEKQCLLKQTFHGWNLQKWQGRYTARESLQYPFYVNINCVIWCHSQGVFCPIEPASLLICDKSL